MSVVDQPVEDGIGQCGVVQVAMPVVDGQLAGDDGAFLVEAVVDDLKQVTAKLVG